MTAPVMRIDGVDYAEKPAPAANNSMYGACGHCALFETPHCHSAVMDGAAEKAFGGDCERRDVIYVKVQA